MLTALHLATRQEYSAHEATYDGLTCPFCKKSHRTTRFASTIHTLRHEYGWDIETDRENGLQANYLVKKAGAMPKDAALIRDDLQRWTCLGYKRTRTGPGAQVKGYISHDIQYPNQPEQSSTTDAEGRWAWGHCSTCGEMTMWQKRKVHVPEANV